MVAGDLNEEQFHLCEEACINAERKAERLKRPTTIEDY